MKKFVKKIIENSIAKCGLEIPQIFSVEEPPRPEMGDWATNIAFLIASLNKTNPKEVASEIKTILESDPDVEKVEIAGPGFLNITLKIEKYFTEMDRILIEKNSFGSSHLTTKKNVNVEYISANPTGPLHIGNARSGPIGEAVANLLEFQGYSVTREFYINDVGVQIGRFGRSLAYWYQRKSNPNIEFPEGGYPGEYIEIISEKIQTDFVDDLKAIDDEEKLFAFFANQGLKITVKGIESDVKECLGIKFDRWSRESELLFSGKAEKVIKRLKETGSTVEKDGALWFKNPDDPELADSESVLIKSDSAKSYTYFTNDLAYHIHKINHGAEILIDIWGANHFGHIPRMKAGMRALGYDDKMLEIIVYQYVRLKHAGQAVSMGKRLGNFVTIRQVIESGVTPDAFKYFILSQNPNTPFDFDLELAADSSDKNPVFYIKYAHSRICSIFAKANIEVGKQSDTNWSLLNDKRETRLIRELAKFPDIISDITANFQIQTIPHYVYKLSAMFNDFYENCQILREEDDLKNARLGLIRATKYVIKNALSILGIDAPDKM